MKLFGLVALMLLIFTGVAAYMLHWEGLLTRETINLFVEDRSEPGAKEPAPIEPVGLAASIQKRERELKEESERLQELNMRLGAQRKELEAERTFIEQRLKSLDPKPEPERAETDEEAEKLAKLVKMYEGMPPEEAAPILESLPEPVVTQILLRMRNRQATRIMGSLSAEKAAEVSKLLIPEELEAAR